MVKAPGQTVRNWLLASITVAEPAPDTSAESKPVGSSRRLNSTGHLMLAGLVLGLAYACFSLAQKDAGKRAHAVAYCQPEPIQARSAQSPTVSTLNILVEALPTSNALQRRRLMQQGNELLALYLYHCKSLQAFSTNYQALLTVANGSAVVSATMVAILSMHGVKSEVRWPFTVLTASAFTLGLTMASIQTFSLNSNLKASRELLERTNALKRSFASSIANQTYKGTANSLNLLNQKELGLFIHVMDQELSQIDIPIFHMDDNFASKEAFLLLNKPGNDEAPPSPERKE